jgi:hypothetical protein
MAITKLKHHDNCECVIKKNTKSKTHYARLICIDCGVFVQHIGRKDFKLMSKLFNEVTIK